MRAICHVALGNNEEALKDLERFIYPEFAVRTLDKMVQLKNTSNPKRTTSPSEYKALAQAGLRCM